MAVRTTMLYIINDLRRMIYDNEEQELDTDQYYPGDTIRLTCVYTNLAGVAVNPTTPTITITDPVGTVKVNAATPTYSGTTGTYYYDYALASTSLDGIWNVVFTGTLGTELSTYRAEFEVTTQNRIWTDQELQDILDRHLYDIDRYELENDVMTKIYSAPFRWLESASIYDGTTDTSALISSLLYTAYLINCRFVFTASQENTYYLTGIAYNVYNAAIDCLTELMASPTQLKSWSRGGISETGYSLEDLIGQYKLLGSQFVGGYGGGQAIGMRKAYS